MKNTILPSLDDKPKAKKLVIHNQGGLKSFIRIIWQNKMSRIGFIILSFFLVLAILGPIFLSPPKANYSNRLQGPSLKHLLGTDYAGKDTLIQLVLGAKDVLLVAFWAGVFSISFACSVGIISGLIGGKIDSILMIFTNVVVTIPGFPVTMILSMLIKTDNAIMFGLLISLWSWAALAKSIRAQVLTIRHKEFIEASRILGLSKITIILNDIVPNIIPYVAVNFIAIMKNAIMASVGLMYLGLVPFQGNHWGMMIQLALTTSGALMGANTMIYFLAPVIGLILFQLGSYLFASGLDEALNPRLRG